MLKNEHDINENHCDNYVCDICISRRHKIIRVADKNQ